MEDYLMTYIATQGLTPDNKPVQLPISGRAKGTSTTLAASGTWSSDWIAIDNYIGVATTLFSDVAGSYTLEYSEDGINVGQMPAVTVQYTQTNQTRKGSFSPSAKYVRFNYTNGSSAQTKFVFNIDLNDTQTQPSSETLNASGADTRMASWTKTRIETKTSDATNDYAPVYRQGNALRVYVDNQSSAVDNSTLAKDTTLTSGNTKVQVTNFPASQAVSGTVTVSNPTAATDISTLSKDATLTNGNTKAQVVNGAGVAYGTLTTPLATRLSDGTNPLGTMTNPLVIGDGGNSNAVSVDDNGGSLTVDGLVSTIEPTNSPSKYIPLSAATLVNNGDKVLHQMIIGNDSSVTFLHLLDQASATTPLIANSKWVLSLAANQAIVLDMMELKFVNGIVLYPSTSATALTLKSPSSMNIQLSSRAA
jgi:hypothetical protein